MTNETSAIKTRIQDDMKTAMRSQEKDRLATLRLILAALKQREVDERITLSDEQVIATLDKMIKQRKDSLAQYESGNRPDLAKKEAEEIKVIQAYLPKPLSDHELKEMIQQTIIATQANGVRDMGKVMNALRPLVQGRADMGQVSTTVKELLITP